MRRVPFRSPASVSIAAACVALVVVVAGCGTNTARAGSDRASSPAAAEDVGAPSSLVGSWLVEAAGEESGAVLRIADDISLFRRCGRVGA